MKPIPDNALPNYDRDEIKDPAAFFRTLFHLRDIKEERAIPAVVTGYDARTGEVTVLPMAKYTFDTRDGEAEIDRETVKVRALKICQGGYSISLPIFKGDTGWLIAGDRWCGAAIEKNGEIVVRDLTDDELGGKTAKPDDCSLLNFNNGFFIPFSWNVENMGDSDSLVIRNVSKNDKLNLTNDHGVYGTYPWSMIEIRHDGTVNAYGQGRKFTIRKDGLYLDDKPLKFLDDLILEEGEGIKIEKTILDDGKIQYVIGNKGVIALERGDNIVIEPVDGKAGTFRISSSGSGTLKSVIIDSPDGSVQVDQDGTDEDQQFHLSVVHPTIGNGTITIKRNGIPVGSFSMNQVGSGEINIEVPVVDYPVTSVSGSGNGISVSPTTGAVVVRNTGVTRLSQSGRATISAATGEVTVGTDIKTLSFTDGTMTLDSYDGSADKSIALNTMEIAEGDGIRLDRSGNVITITNTREGGGGEQLQSDWGQTDDTAKDFIKNKPTIPTIPGITVAHTGSGEVVTDVAANGHSLTVTLGNVTKPSGSDYIDVSSTGVVSANVPTDGTKGLVTTDTAQTIKETKTFRNDSYAGANYYLKINPDGIIYFYKISNNSLAGIINCTTYLSFERVLQIAGIDFTILGEHVNDTMLAEHPTISATGSGKQVATCGWVNDMYKVTELVTDGDSVGISITPDATNPKKLKLKNTGIIELVEGDNITLTPDEDDPRKVTIEATQQTIPDIEVDTSAVTSGKAVGGLSVDSTNKHKIIASAIDIPDVSTKADKATNLIGATKCKITYNSQGIVTAGENLSASDLPSHTHTKSQITDFPTALKNPYALTFTGAASGSYDGSAAKTVNIPDAPQGEKTWTVDGTSVTVNASAAKAIKSNVKSDWNATGGDSEILNKPELAAVATSGDYEDLTNKPNIPTIPGITVTHTGSGEVVTDVAANGHSLTVTLGNVTKPSGSDYIDVSSTGVVSANVPTDNINGLVTTDTAQTIRSTKTFKETLSGNTFKTEIRGNGLFVYGTNGDSLAGYITPNGNSLTPNGLFVYGNIVFANSSANKVFLSTHPTVTSSSNENEKHAIPTCGWVFNAIGSYDFIADMKYDTTDHKFKKLIGHMNNGVVTYGENNMDVGNIAYATWTDMVGGETVEETV